MQEDTDMTHLTTLDELKQNITLLPSVEESDAPFISAYFNLENGPAGWRETLDDRARILRRVLKDNDLADFEEALGKIEAWLATDLLRLPRVSSMDCAARTWRSRVRQTPWMRCVGGKWTCW